MTNTEQILIEVDVSPTAYREGHVPGAQLWNIYADLRHPDYSPVTTAELNDLLSRSGIDRESTVGFYGYGAHLGFWLLQSIGHERVLFFDGDRSGSIEEPVLTPTTYPPIQFDPKLHATRESVLAMIDAPGHVILDVRSQAEYGGERFWPSGATEGAGRAGHIPGSVHMPIERFREPDVREALLEAGVTPEQRIVTYCTIGNRASQAWLALSRLGYDDVGVYAGSWAEWGLLPDTPVEATERSTSR